MSERARSRGTLLLRRGPCGCRGRRGGVLGLWIGVFGCGMCARGSVAFGASLTSRTSVPGGLLRGVVCAVRTTRSPGGAGL